MSAKRKFVVEEPDASHSHEKEWVGMPEFKQDRQRPFSQIIVRCETEEDLNAFAKAIGQKLTSKTKSTWYPETKRGVHSGKVYVCES